MQGKLGTIVERGGGRIEKDRETERGRDRERMNEEKLWTSNIQNKINLREINLSIKPTIRFYNLSQIRQRKYKFHQTFYSWENFKC